MVFLGGSTIKTEISIRPTSLRLELINELEFLVFGNQLVTQVRLAEIINKQPLLLVAYQGAQPVGFKFGYVIPDTQTFFSWLGGVQQSYRRQGIAQQLLNYQENTALGMGLDKIYFTTFDRFPAMISLGKKNGYRLIRSELDEGELKYWYEKFLSKS